MVFISKSHSDRICAGLAAGKGRGMYAIHNCFCGPAFYTLGAASVRVCENNSGTN
jgi:hypothetical protein